MEDRIRLRDKVCVYCGKRFTPNPKDRATWEHIDNDASNITDLKVGLSCNSCTVSKGAKKLGVWLKSEYYRIKRMGASSVAIVVRLLLSARGFKPARSD
jgi:hypothetical protein